MQSHPIGAQFAGVIMLGLATAMFASNFHLNQRRIDVPHSYVVAGIVVALAWLVSFVMGMAVRHRAGLSKVSLDRSRHLYPAIAIGLTVLLGMPVGRFHSSFLFPPQWQVIGDAVGVVVSSSLALLIVVIVIRSLIASKKNSPTP